MLTVACVWVHANVPYGVEYVEKLHGMVSRHVDGPCRFVCLTDRPTDVPAGVEAIEISHPAGLYGWWAKVHLFNSAHGLTGRVLYLDLDTLVVSSLEPIVKFPAAFALVPHAGTFNGKNGLSVVKKFNSSVMVWDAGTQDHIYHLWSRDVAHRLHGDQDYIGEVASDAVAMPLEWFPRLSELGGLPPPLQAKIVLAKKPKNSIAAKRYPWVREVWG